MLADFDKSACSSSFELLLHSGLTATWAMLSSIFALHRNLSFPHCNYLQRKTSVSIALGLEAGLEETSFGERNEWLMRIIYGNRCSIARETPNPKMPSVALSRYS